MRPTSLVRSDSDAPMFTAPAVNIRQGEIDCGIKVLPCCLPSWCHRFATPNWFLFFFIILGIVQGSAQAYFASTARHIGEIFGYSNELIDWLLVSNDLFMATFIFFIAYWGNKIHRPAWLGGLACLQGVSSILVFIPYLEFRNKNGTNIISDPSTNLCVEDNPFYIKFELMEEMAQIDYVTIVALFIAQLFIGLGNASFYTHGFSYIDDNVEKNNSVIYIAIGLAVRLSAIQFGSFMAWCFLRTGGSWWIGYSIIGAMLIFFGTMIALFPKRLLGTVIRQTAATILNTAIRNETERHLDYLEPDYSFSRSMKRLFTNKVVIINTAAIFTMLLATYNFLWYEPKFMESQFYLPSIGVGFHDPWRSRLWRNISGPPIIFLMVLISGLIISRNQPKPRNIVIWNVVTTVVVAGMCFSYGFIDCNKGGIAGAYKGHLTSPYCSFLCKCDENAKFEPVCTQDVHTTYYSPCHAGCRDILFINNVKVYNNCSCSASENQIKRQTTIAMEGACDNSECAKEWIIYQSLTVLSAAILGSGFLGSFYINLRSAFIMDRAMVIAFQFFFIGLMIHVPGKFIYKAIADSNCQYYNDKIGQCNLYNEKFGDLLGIVTGSFLLVSAILYLIVVFIVKDVELFDEEDMYPDTPMPKVTNRPMTTFSYTPSSDVDSEYARPLRTPRSSSTYSSGSTRVSSIDFTQPVQHQNQRRTVDLRSINEEQRPISRDEAHRNVIDELQHLNGTPV